MDQEVCRPRLFAPFRSEGFDWRRHLRGRLAADHRDGRPRGREGVVPGGTWYRYVKRAADEFPRVPLRSRGTLKLAARAATETKKPSPTGVSEGG